MKREYIGIALAKRAIGAIDSLNDSRRKNLDLWKKVLEARENHEKTANIQSSKAFPQALSATINITGAIAAASLKTLARTYSKLTPLVNALDGVNKSSTLISGIWTSRLDGDETTSKAKANEKESEQQMMRSEMSGSESMIRTISDIASRAISSLGNIF